MECACLPCDTCRDVEWPEYRNKICAAAAGGLFTLGWWLAIGELTSQVQGTLS